MGHQAHSTTRPATDDMDVNRTRLKRDLSDCDSVISVRDDGFARNGIVFTTASGDLEPGVFRVLADHGAILPKEQPENSDTHNALIKL